MHEVKLSKVNEVLAEFDIKVVVDGASPVPPKPDDPPKPPPDGIIDCSYKDIIHHYNPHSLIDSKYPRGKGVSFIFCFGDKYESVTFNGVKFRCQDENDEGREWWTNIDFRKQQPVAISGTVLAKHRNGKTYRFSIPAGGKDYLAYKGKCFGKKSGKVASKLKTSKDI